MRNSIKSLPTLYLLLFTAGCGGSGGETCSEPPTPAPTGGGDDPVILELNGIAADGYLHGATVCLNTDEDDSFAGESSAATTSEVGPHSL